MKRLRLPDYLVGLGGIAIIVSLFVPEHALVAVVLLVIAGLMAIALPVVTAVRDDPALPVKWDVLTAWATLVGIIAAALDLLGGVDGGGLAALGAVLFTFLACAWALRKQDAPGLRTPPPVRAMPTPPAHDPVA